MKSTFLINMDSATGKIRLQRMERECAKAGITFERVPGVDGKRVSDDELEKTVGVACRYLCSPSMIGIGLSHMKIWQRIVDENIGCALIMEDDCVLCPNFVQRMNSALSSVPPDFHVLLLGCFFCPPLTKKNVPTETHETPRIAAFAGLHCYVVSLEGAKLLLENIPRVKYHIDMQMNHIDGLKLYKTREQLASQNGNDTSSNVNIGFPGSLNTLFSKIEISEKTTLDFHANSVICRLGTYEHHVIITHTMLAFVLLGIVGVPWKLVAGFSVLDIAFFPPSTLVDPMQKLGAFAVGLLINRAVMRLVSKK